MVTLMNEVFSNQFLYLDETPFFNEEAISNKK